MCLSHLIYTVRPCLIHICHAAPMPCSDHAVLLKIKLERHSKTLSARRGRGTSWALHAMCESAFSLQAFIVPTEANFLSKLRYLHTNYTASHSEIRNITIGYRDNNKCHWYIIPSLPPEVCNDVIDLALRQATWQLSSTSFPNHYSLPSSLWELNILRQWHCCWIKLQFK
jgi:hypothetical protein